MQNLFENYIHSISSKFSHEETSEIGYRTDFEILLKEIFATIKVHRIDHDARATKGNKPDFIVLKDKIPLLYIEAKDINISLDKVEKSEQMSRYYGYTNLVLTNYVEFRFYRNGSSYSEPIKIADYDIKNRVITSIPQNYDYLAKTLLDFTQSQKEPIRSANHLAKIMGGKAQRIRDNIRQFLSSGSDKNKGLELIFESLKKQLVHDLTEHTFADMYAQTLVYGLFTARFFDKTSDSFSRREARDLIPKSNPLLRHFFDHLTGSDFDERLEYIVDELCEVFSHADVVELMKEYSQKELWNDEKVGKDPVIHFYEDFLKEYDPELRKKMGAYYTPLPVVQFIVHSVDHLLKKEFSLVNGLADTTKNSDGIHKVQILDPAVGTGTFISKVIGNIYESLGKGQGGRWPAYVQNDLLPRLYGFELMMTPYTIAHLKLSLAFEQTGFKYFNNKRLGIYLTNSLEHDLPQKDLFPGLGFSNSIAEEAEEALKIKNDKPIMVVLGNPPYSGESSNKGKWIMDQMQDYKKEPGGKVKLQERNPKWINDDYVKFLRFGQYFIEKNKTGILAFINPHGFLDNPTFRGMRWNLLKTYDKIYVLDLHGNAKKKEVAPDGTKDENVFDIQQGVSINIFVKTGEKLENDLAKVYHADVWGKRTEKFEYLNSKTINTVAFTELQSAAPMYFMVPKNFSLEKEYKEGFSLNELFPVTSIGVVTSNDKILIDDEKVSLLKKVENYYKISADDKYVQKICYRPFDNKYIYYDSNLIERTRSKAMQHFVLGNNIGIVFRRQQPESKDLYLFLADNMMADGFIRSDNKGGETVAPLYVYLNGERIPNLNKEIIGKIDEIVNEGLPEDIFDYIYAILHSPNYREKYKEFLKIDFPRVPYPKDKETFTKLVKLGTELRQLHLLESPKVNKFITTYPIAGSDIVEKIEYKDENVYINGSQYFGNVSEVAWDFYIGGYQPAKKWLKDRKGRKLINENIEHYQKMIVSLSETDRIIKKIDEVSFI